MVKTGSLWLNQKPLKLLFILTLAFIISAPLILPQKAAAQTGGLYDKSFAWNYNGKYWTWNLSISQNLYDSYKSVPVYQSNCRWSSRLRFSHNNR